MGSGNQKIPKDFKVKESILSETGKARIKAALDALEKGEIKEFDNVEDLIKEINS